MPAALSSSGSMRRRDRSSAASTMRPTPTKSSRASTPFDSDAPSSARKGHNRTLSTTKICKTLAVWGEANRDSVMVTLYLKVAIPVVSATFEPLQVFPLFPDAGIDIRSWHVQPISLYDPDGGSSDIPSGTLYSRHCTADEAQTAAFILGVPLSDKTPPPGAPKSFHNVKIGTGNHSVRIIATPTDGLLSAESSNPLGAEYLINIKYERRYDSIGPQWPYSATLPIPPCLSSSLRLKVSSQVLNESHTDINIKPELRTGSEMPTSTRALRRHSIKPDGRSNKAGASGNTYGGPPEENSLIFDDTLDESEFDIDDFDGEIIEGRFQSAEKLEIKWGRHHDSSAMLPVARATSSLRVAFRLPTQHWYALANRSSFTLELEFRMRVTCDVSSFPYVQDFARLELELDTFEGAEGVETPLHSAGFSVVEWDMVKAEGDSFLRLEFERASAGSEDVVSAPTFRGASVNDRAQGPSTNDSHEARKAKSSRDRREPSLLRTAPPFTRSSIETDMSFEVADLAPVSPLSAFEDDTESRWTAASRAEGSERGDDTFTAPSITEASRGMRKLYLTFDMDRIRKSGGRPDGNRVVDFVVGGTVLLERAVSLSRPTIVPVIRMPNSLAHQCTLEFDPLTVATLSVLQVSSVAKVQSVPGGSPAVIANLASRRDGTEPSSDKHDSVVVSLGDLDKIRQQEEVAPFGSPPSKSAVEVDVVHQRAATPVSIPLRIPWALYQIFWRPGKQEKKAHIDCRLQLDVTAAVLGRCDVQLLFDLPDGVSLTTSPASVAGRNVEIDVHDAPRAQDSGVQKVLGITMDGLNGIREPSILQVCYSIRSESASPIPLVLPALDCPITFLQVDLGTPRDCSLWRQSTGVKEEFGPTFTESDLQSNEVPDLSLSRPLDQNRPSQRTGSGLVPSVWWWTFIPCAVWCLLSLGSELNSLNARFDVVSARLDSFTVPTACPAPPPPVTIYTTAATSSLNPSPSPSSPRSISVLTTATLRTRPTTSPPVPDEVQDEPPQQLPPSSLIPAPAIALLRLLLLPRRLVNNGLGVLHRLLSELWN